MVNKRSLVRFPLGDKLLGAFDSVPSVSESFPGRNEEFPTWKITQQRRRKRAFPLGAAPKRVSERPDDRGRRRTHASDDTGNRIQILLLQNDAGSGVVHLPRRALALLLEDHLVEQHAAAQRPLRQKSAPKHGKTAHVKKSSAAARKLADIVDRFPREIPLSIREKVGQKEVKFQTKR